MRKRCLWPVLLFGILCMMIFGACGKKESIYGTWVLVRVEYSDGTVLKGDTLDTYECYEIREDGVQYTCSSESLKALNGEGKLSFPLTMTEVGDKTYRFDISERLTFVTGTIVGKTLQISYSDDNGKKDTYIYEKE